MARIKLSAIASDIRGKLNGGTLQGSPSGLILRNNFKRKPQLSNPQMEVLGAIQKYKAEYQNLIPAYKEGIELRRHMFLETNQFGDKYPLTALNYVAKVRGIAELAIPLQQTKWNEPIKQSFLHLDYYPVVISPQSIRLLGSFTPLVNANIGVCYMAESRGINSVKPPTHWKYIANFSPFEGSFTIFYTRFKQSTLRNNQKDIWLKVVRGNIYSGWFAPPEYYRVLNNSAAVPFP